MDALAEVTRVPLQQFWALEPARRTSRAVSFSCCASPSRQRAQASRRGCGWLMFSHVTLTRRRPVHPSSNLRPLDDEAQWLPPRCPAALEELLRAHLHVESEDRNDRISALMFSGTMPPQLPVLIALIQILLGCDRRRRIRAPFGAL